MGGSWKILYGGEWAKIMPLVNKHFKPIDSSCEMCRKGSCAAAWMSIKTKRMRCKKCFTPPGYAG